MTGALNMPFFRCPSDIAARARDGQGDMFTSLNERYLRDKRVCPTYPTDFDRLMGIAVRLPVQSIQGDSIII
jgi:hypothetical protein